MVNRHQRPQKAGIESDNEFAGLLGITRGAVSQWRTGRVEISVEHKLILADVFGYSFAYDAITSLFSKEKIREICARIAAIREKINAAYLKVSDIMIRIDENTLLDKFKKAFQIESDVLLSKILDTTPSQISNWRSGKSPAPLPIKLRILDHLEYPNIRDYVLVFVPTKIHQAGMAADMKRMHERGIKKR